MRVKNNTTKISRRKKEGRADIKVAVDVETEISFVAEEVPVILQSYEVSVGGSPVKLLLQCQDKILPVIIDF